MSKRKAWRITWSVVRLGDWSWGVRRCDAWTGDYGLVHACATRQQARDFKRERESDAGRRGRR